MSNSAYKIRNYQPEDFDGFVKLNIEAEKLEPTGRQVSPRAIAENLSRPNYSPEQDLFLAQTDGKIIGYMNLAPELKISRVILDCWVHPEHRRRGLATKLSGDALRQAEQLGAKIAHINIMEDNKVARKALSSLGFKSIRRFLELKLDMARIRWQNLDQINTECCHLLPGEESKLVHIQNRSFADTWGYNPNTTEEIGYKINSSNHSPEDVVLAYDGDKVIGYCWTEVLNNQEADGRRGRIYMIGTDPDYRGRGVGKKMMLTGLAYLKNKGVAITELTVDSENKPALALYRSVGFEVQASSLWYEKKIAQGTGTE